MNAVNKTLTILRTTPGIVSENVFRYHGIGHASVMSAIQIGRQGGMIIRRANGLGWGMVR